METVIGDLVSHPWGPSEDACRPLVFVIGPCGPREGEGLGAYANNFMRARHVVELLTSFRVAAVCPLLSHQLMDGILPAQDLFRIGVVIAGRCDAVVRLGGWQEGEGCQAIVAALRGRDTTYFDWPEGPAGNLADCEAASRVADWATKFMRDKLSNSPANYAVPRAATYANSPYPATPMADIRDQLRRPAQRDKQCQGEGSRGPEPVKVPAAPYPPG